jgi:hypothetical protein
MSLSIPHCALSVFLLSWTVLERFNIPHFLNIVELIINDALHFQTFLPSFRLCALYSYFQLPPLPLGSLNVEATVEIKAAAVKGYRRFSTTAPGHIDT